MPQPSDWLLSGRSHDSLILQALYLPADQRPLEPRPQEAGYTVSQPIRFRPAPCRRGSSATSGRKLTFRSCNALSYKVRN